MSSLPILAQRDPIAGRGDFGEREWDPIWKYNGRVRRARSSTGKNNISLPLNYIINFLALAKSSCRNHVVFIPRKFMMNVQIALHVFAGIRCNPLTGENAKTFDISTEEKRRCSLTPKTPRECKLHLF